MKTRVRAQVLAGVLILLLGACAQIPRSSDVTAGGRVDVPADSRGLEPVASGPVRGARPQQIVQGLLESMNSSVDGFQVSREFLERDMAARWQPHTQTSVFIGNPVVRLGKPTAGRVQGTVRVTQAATIDINGRYRRQTPGPRVFAVELVQDAERQWRISRLPDLTAISAADFQFTYRAHPVYLLSQDLHHLVPTSCYLANGAGMPTRLAAAVLNGAPADLRAAYGTAVPQGTRLAPPAVVTTRGDAAIVDLTPEASAASPQQRVALRAQLLATLRAVLSISDVKLTVNGGELDISPDLAPPGPVQQPGGEPVVLRGSRLATFNGEQLTPATDMPSLSSIDPTDVALSQDGGRLAVLGRGRSRLYLTGPSSPLGDPVLTGANLTAPTFDPGGAVWTASSPSSGQVQVIQGATMRRVAAPWLAGRRVRALSLSPDGGLAAVVSSRQGHGRLDIVAVRRDGEEPVELIRAATSTRSLADENVRSVSWRSCTELAMATDRQVSLLPLDGPIAVAGKPLVVRSVASGAGPGVGDLAVGTTGRLYEYDSDGWYRVPHVNDVLSAAFPQ